MDVESCMANAGNVPYSSRPMFATVFLLTTMISVITNFMLLFVIVWHWKKSFQSQTFILFVLNMIASGLILTSTNLYVSVPCAIDECPFIRTDTAMIILASPNTLGHWGYLFSSFGLTIYRFGLFLSKEFEEKRLCVKVLLIGPWLLALIITWGTTVLKCLKRFNRHSLRYTFDCSSCETLFRGFSFLDFDLYTGLAIPLIMVATYAMIIFSIYRSRRANRINLNQSLEEKLALQYLVICFSQFLATFSFYVIPKIGNGSDWSTLALNSIGPINVSINPCVLLLSNQKLRRVLPSSYEDGL